MVQLREGDHPEGKLVLKYMNEVVVVGVGMFVYHSRLNNNDRAAVFAGA